MQRLRPAIIPAAKFGGGQQNSIVNGIAYVAPHLMSAILRRFRRSNNCLGRHVDQAWIKYLRTAHMKHAASRGSQGRRLLTAQNQWTRVAGISDWNSLQQGLGVRMGGRGEQGL